MSSPSLRIESRQHQVLTPRLQQAVRLLQLSSLDFAQEVQQALGSNPFLEEDAETAAADAAPSATEDYGAPEADADPWSMRSTSSAAPARSDGDFSLAEMVPQGETLGAHLHGQINVMPLSPRDRALAAMLIESLDEDGYLRQDLDELRVFAELDPPTRLDELRVALRLVQSLDPLGVGARDLRECLKLQAAQLEPGQRALAMQVLDGRLERLASRDASRLAGEIGCEPARMAAVCDRIRRFDPKPGWRFDGSRTQYVTPDVIVRRTKGRTWSVALNPDVVPKVRLNSLYADLFQRHRETGQGELAAHLREARWTLRNVEQRFHTILDVANAIVARQHRFFEYGALAMKPMCLREVAREVGVHESTVCRVTNNKYMATPAGVFELKYFFSRSLSTRTGEAASSTAIRGLIRELIEGESRTKPLSDVQIASQLVRQGINVARRTVTKYRQSMRLPAVDRRREAAA